MAVNQFPQRSGLHPFSIGSSEHSDPILRRVIALGASAGGLQAISTILAKPPASFPAPIVIVQHLSPHSPSQMAAILSHRTALQVKEAEAGDRLRAGTVYVAPPAWHLIVSSDEILFLSDADKVHHSRPAVDVLFLSLAESCGDRAVGVVLTGGNCDGTAGLQAIKAAGGTTFAQDEQSSEDVSMPRHAAAAGAVDFVLPLPDIAAALVALVSPSIAIRSGEVGLPSNLRNSNEELAAGAKLDLCSEALCVAEESLRVAEEALRVQGDVIAGYKKLFLTLTPENQSASKVRKDTAEKR